MDYKKNLKMNETLEKEQMMKQMNSNLQNKMHKQRQKWSIFMYKLRIKEMSVLEILDLVGVQKSIHPVQDTTAAPTQLYIRKNSPNSDLQNYLNQFNVRTVHY
jgi:hypothetical protein